MKFPETKESLNLLNQNLTEITTPSLMLLNHYLCIVKLIER